MADLIMAWSKCSVSVDGAELGIIKQDSATLSGEEGDALQAIEVGGAVVAEERKEGTLQFQCTVIEPQTSVLASLGLASGDSVTTHVVKGYHTLSVVPKNEGAMGITCPRVSISYQPAWAEDTGNEGIFTFRILKTVTGENDYWYSRTVKPAAQGGNGG